MLPRSWANWALMVFRSSCTDRSVGSVHPGVVWVPTSSVCREGPSSAGGPGAQRLAWGESGAWGVNSRAWGELSPVENSRGGVSGAWGVSGADGASGASGDSGASSASSGSGASGAAGALGAS
ncbi:hypothetical protein XENTR_v10005587 [Xenopus tropicalis]|nr:hypothetical protein XENTR_v10005587 [Xenopus tropicalis]